MESLFIASRNKPKASPGAKCREACAKKNRIIGRVTHNKIIDAARSEDWQTTDQICNLSGFTRRTVVKHLTNAGWQRKPFGRTFKWKEVK